MTENIENLSEKVKEILNLNDDIEDLNNDRMLQDKCGLFGCIANGEWPTNLDVAHIICLGLVGLQHRFLLKKISFIYLLIGFSSYYFFLLI